jgi:poly(hydroxyalkanoate) granule-associated protein
LLLDFAFEGEHKSLQILSTITIKEREMGKKLKALAGSLTEGQLATSVKESAQQIWLAGLGAFAKAQEEGNKVFDALVKEGENIQSKTRKMTDDKIAAVAGKAAVTWERLEQGFEERVARALSSLGVPSQKDIDTLNLRVAELTAVVQELTEARAKAEEMPAVAPVQEASKESAEVSVETPVAAPSEASSAIPGEAPSEAQPPKPVAKAAPKKPAVKKAVTPPASEETAAKPAAKKPASKKVATKPADTPASEPVAVPPVTPAEVLKGIADSNG